MTRFAKLAVLCLGSALLASSALAQQARKFDLSETAQIAAVDIEVGRITLQDAARGSFEVLVDARTRLLRGAHEVGIDQLRAGERVVVDLRKQRPADGEGKLVADRVVVVVAPPAEAE